MGAFDEAKRLSSEKAGATIASSGLQEYGVYHGPVFEKWAAVQKNRTENETKGPLCVVAALNNADSSGVLLGVLKRNAEDVLQGLCIAAYVTGAEKKRLLLPADARELAAALQEPAGKLNIEVAIGLVDVRENKKNIVSHLVTMKNISDLFSGCYEEKVYVSVNGGTLFSVDKTATVAEVLGAAKAPLDDVKAIEAGYHLYTTAVLDETVESAEITNGVLKVWTSKQCVMTELEGRLSALCRQSCGKCVFCREGLFQLHGMEKDMMDGKGKMSYTEYISEIGTAMAFSSLCSLGQQSANMALDSMKYFDAEYDAHIKKKKCPAGVCSAFSAIYIDPQLCEGCEECAEECPQSCIEGKKGFIHRIETVDCSKCGKCIEICTHGAIIETTGRVPKLPERLTKCGKFKRH